MPETSPFFGELYLRSTAPFLSEATTQREVTYLQAAFQDTTGPIADLGCGQGRHAAPLNTEGPLRGRIIGVDDDAYTHAHRLPGFPFLRADLRALPFSDASLAGAYAWYSSLFVFDDATHERILKDLRRILKPEGRLLLNTVPFEHLAAQPPARLRIPLPDGSLLEDQSAFDAVTGWDRGQRVLTEPTGRVLSAPWAVRYYPLAQLEQLLETAGFWVRWVHGGTDGAPLGPESTELIIAAECSGARKQPHG